MYFTNKNNFFHGIMFHHFHDEYNHPKSQGSISQEDLISLIDFIGRKNILNHDEFLYRFQNDKLNDNHVCFTFDDGIKAQIDVALPILNEFKINSFFFVQSSIFDNGPDKIEIYRYFRCNSFKSIDEFYDEFFLNCNNSYKNFLDTQHLRLNEYKNKFQSYSSNDIKFRIIRDLFLSAKEYDDIMNYMMNKKKFDVNKIKKNLVFSKEDIKLLLNNNHAVGLHSHSHPMLLEKLSYEEQYDEYSKNLSILNDLVSSSFSKINSMSHPCGSYNENTKKILENLNIQIGFKQIMTPDKGMMKINNSKFEIAREDHSNIMRAIIK